MTQGNHLAGTKIVLTGDFDAYDRKEATAVLEGLGADVTGSVSGKTMVVIVGENPGSKVQKAEARGIPLLGEAEMLAMIAGKTLAEVLEGDLGEQAVPDEKPAADMPFVTAPPRNGEYVTHYEDGKVHVSGTYKDGLKTGSWKVFWPNGQIKEDYMWESGLKHGPELDWTEDGVQTCDGVNNRHVRTGTWTWWHKNGVYMHAYTYDENGLKHGDYVWNADDETPRARGAFYHDKFDGQWEWTNEPHHEKIKRGYVRGQYHGEDTGWFHGGQLAYRRFYEFGSKHGEEETYYENGKPRFKGTWQYGMATGTHLSWDADGNETKKTYVLGLPEGTPPPKKVASLVKKLGKAKDSYAKSDAIDNVVEWGERGALVYHLWKNDLYDVPADPELWEILAGSMALLSGADIIEFLKDATNKGVYGPHLPYWDRQMDRIVMNIYARDPDPIDAGWQDLPTRNKMGVAFVLARFGKDVGNILADQMGALAKQHAENYGLGERILWPNEAGQIVEEKLFVDHRKKPTELFEKFLKIFGTQEAWISALTPYANKEIKENVQRFSFTTFRPLVEAATVDQMITYCESISLDGSTHELVHEALWDWRSDDADAMTKMALGVNDTGLRKWPVVCAAILKLQEEGKEIPQSLVDVFELDAESPTYSSAWSENPIRTLPEDLQADPAHIASTLSMPIGASVPRSKTIHAALSAMSDEQVRQVFERTLASDYGKTKVSQFLYRLNDPELVDRLIEVAEADSYGHQPRVTWGLGAMGLSAIPKLEAAMNRATKTDFKEGWWQGIICALTRAAVDGETIDPEYDKYIRFDGMHDEYYYRFLRPMMERLLFLMPQPRVEAILLAGLQKKSTYWRALRFVATGPTEPVLTAAFGQLLEFEQKMKYEQGQDLTFALKGLHNGREWVKWVLMSGGGGGSKEALKDGIGWKAFEEIEKELAAGGVEKPVELDHIDKVVKMAQDAGNKGETLYLLRRLEATTSDDLNVIGGAAPGVFTDRWPMFDDEPMSHLFTLDLKTMPELQKRYKARAMSVFCASPDYNEAWEPDNGWTAIIFSTDDDIAAEGEIPEDIEVEHEATFEAVSVLVNVYDEEMRQAIYRCGGRVMGDPMWLQGDDYDGDFVMQFDEQFSYMNLGDMGIMYVFSDTAFWQCH